MRIRVFAAMLLAAVTAPAAADKTSALDALILEDKILGVGWRGGFLGSTLIVKVEDDGSLRDGYAEYVCLVLKEHGVNVDDSGYPTLVRVFDFQVWLDSQMEKELGAALCPKS